MAGRLHCLSYLSLRCLPKIRSCYCYSIAKLFSQIVWLTCSKHIFHVTYLSFKLDLYLNYCCLIHTQIRSSVALPFYKVNGILYKFVFLYGMRYLKSWVISLVSNSVLLVLRDVLNISSMVNTVRHFIALVLRSIWTLHIRSNILLITVHINIMTI